MTLLDRAKIWGIIISRKQFLLFNGPAKSASLNSLNITPFTICVWIKSLIYKRHSTVKILESIITDCLSALRMDNELALFILKNTKQKKLTFVPGSL